MGSPSFLKKPRVCFRACASDRDDSKKFLHFPPKTVRKTQHH